MNTKFKTTADAAANLADNPQMAQAVNEEIRRNTLVSMLLSMRVAKGLTQEAIATRMKCDPSKISRIESGNDKQLKWLDIARYAAALEVQMSILFDDESLPAAARIKQCVFKIDDDLRKLAGMAQQFDGDDQIVLKINEFYKEVLFNFIKRYSENHERLTAFISIPPKMQTSLFDEDCTPTETSAPCNAEPTHR